MTRSVSVGLWLLFASSIHAAEPVARLDTDGSILPTEALRRFGSGKFTGGPFALAAFSHDGKVVFTVPPFGNAPVPKGVGLSAWDVSSGKRLWSSLDDTVLALCGGNDDKSVFAVTAKSPSSSTPLRFQKLAIADGKTLEDRPLCENIAYSPTVYPDGCVTFVERGKTGLSMMAVVQDGKGKTILRYTTETDGGLEHVRHSPDRSFIVVTAYPQNNPRQFGTSIGMTTRMFAVSVKTGKELWTQDVLAADAVLSPDGMHIYTISPVVFRPQTPPKLSRHDSATGKVEASEEIAGADGSGWRNKRLLAIRPDGKAVFVRGGDSETLVVNSEKLKIESRLYAGLFEGWFSRDGKVAAASGGLNLTLHDLPTGRLRAAASTPLPQARWPQYQFAKNGKTVTRVGGESAITWDVASGREVSRMTPEKVLGEGVPGVPLIADNYPKRLTTRSPDGKAVLSYSNPNIQQLQFELTLKVNGKEWPDTGLTQRLVGCLQMAFTPDGRYALAQFDQEHLQIWDLKGEASAGSGITFATPGPSGARQVPLMHPAPDSRHVALVEADPQPQMFRPQFVGPNRWQLGNYDLASRRRVTGVSGTGVLTSVAWSDDASRIAGGGKGLANDGFAFVAAANGKYLMEPFDLQEPVTAVALSPDNRTLAVGCGGKISLYEVRSRSLRHTFRPNAGDVTALRFLADSTSLVSESTGGAIYLWDMRGELVSQPAPDANTLERLWKELQDADAATAFQAVRQLAKHPAITLPFVKGKVTGQKRPAAAEIEARVTRLKSRDFAEREKAERELRLMGRIAWPTLKAAVASDSTPELQSRARKLLAVTISPVGLRTCRLVEVLEFAGTKEAQALLTTWAAEAGPELAVEATDALERRKK